jgi:hypothetical protein
MANFKYFGTTLTNRIQIQEKFKIRINYENACYHTVKNLSYSLLLPKSGNLILYIKHKFTCCFCRCKLLSHIKGKTEIGDIKEEESEQNI